MHQVFINKLLQIKFEQKGYVVIPSLLEKKELDYLNNFVKKFSNKFIGAFHTSHFSTDVSYKRQAHEAITSIVFPKASTYLNCYKPILGNFMIKNPDTEFAMDLHADWTYVNEEKYCSIAIWVPLVDVNEKNGCLGVIEKSHKITNKVRGPLIRQSSRIHDKEWENNYGKFIPLKAGDAVIYNHSLLHFSPPNKTNEIRPAINLSVVPEEANCIHYCQPEGSNNIEVYNVPDSDFYIRYNHFQRPESQTLINLLPPDCIKYIDKKMQSFWKYRIIENVKHWI